jgi:hypothetical protein
MKTTVFGKLLLVAVLVASFALPRGIVFAATPAEQTTVRDVALQKDGMLVGQLVDRNGQPQAGVPVTILSDNKPVATATTDKNGIFTFRGLRGGLYHLTGANGVAAYRVWQPQLAPPGSSPSAVVIAGEDLVRGQCPAPLRAILTRPLVIAGIVGAAIAIPVAIAASEDEEEAPATP